MSHDRGCHCGRESFEYDDCPLNGCNKRPGPDPVAAAVKPKTKGAETNPKTRFGVQKVSMTKVPGSAMVHMADAMMDGANKYGASNWRASKVEASIYIDAAYRHIMAWYDGEEVAEDSEVHHLGHAMASLAIILDAMEGGTLIDDRPMKGPVTKAMAKVKARLARRAKP